MVSTFGVVRQSQVPSTAACPRASPHQRNRIGRLCFGCVLFPPIFGGVPLFQGRRHKERGTKAFFLSWESLDSENNNAPPRPPLPRGVCLCLHLYPGRPPPALRPPLARNLPEHEGRVGLLRVALKLSDHSPRRPPRRCRRRSCALQVSLRHPPGISVIFLAGMDGLLRWLWRGRGGDCTCTRMEVEGEDGYMD